MRFIRIFSLVDFFAYVFCKRINTITLTLFLDLHAYIRKYVLVTLRKFDSNQSIKMSDDYTKTTIFYSYTLNIIIQRKRKIREKLNVHGIIHYSLDTIIYTHFE